MLPDGCEFLSSFSSNMVSSSFACFSLHPPPLLLSPRGVEATDFLQKVKFGAEQYEALKKFEAQHHPVIWKWILEKARVSLAKVLSTRRPAVLKSD